MTRTLPSLLAACLALVLAACKDGSDGPTDAGASGTQVLTGTLRLPDGKPAAGAQVRLYPVDFVPGPAGAAKAGVPGPASAAAPSPASAATGDAAYVTRTAADGSYSVDSLEQGEYNILSELDGLVAYQDSVFLIPGRAAEASAELQPGGSVTARVQLQPHHDARSATVHVLGTRAFSNVDEDGRFTLQGLAAGTYALRINPGTDGYTILYTSLTVRSGEKDSLTAALRPDFTGIPVVTGIRAQLDTLAGTVRVSWDPVAYRRLKSYVILRQRSDDPLPSAEVIGAATGTDFTDTLYPETGHDYGLASGNFPRPIPWEYQVRVRNQSEQLGEVFGGATVETVPPSWVRTHVEFRLLGAVNGEASRDDTVKVVALFRNKTRKLTRVWWRDTGKEVVRDAELGAGTASGSDTLILVGDRLGARTVECQVVDESGEAPTHRFGMAFVAMPPTADAGADVELERNKTHVLKGMGSTRIGQVVKYEWDVGATGSFVEAPGGELAITTPNTYGRFPCILRVTNEDGETTLDGVDLILRDVWKKAGTVPFHGNSSQLVRFKNRFWHIGWWYSGDDRETGLYSSPDGVTWQEETPNTKEPPRRVNHAAFVLRDTLWVVGGGRKSSDEQCLEESFATADGVNWSSAGAAPFASCVVTKAVVIRDTVYLIGYHGYPFAYSADARNWTRVQPDQESGPGAVNFLGIVNGAAYMGIGSENIPSRISYWSFKLSESWNRYGTLGGAINFLKPGWILHEDTLNVFGGQKGESGLGVNEIYSSRDGKSWYVSGIFPKSLGTAPTALVHEGKMRIFSNGEVFSRD